MRRRTIAVKVGSSNPVKARLISDSPFKIKRLIEFRHPTSHESYVII